MTNTTKPRGRTSRLTEEQQKELARLATLVPKGRPTDGSKTLLMAELAELFGVSERQVRRIRAKFYGAQPAKRKKEKTL